MAEHKCPLCGKDVASDDIFCTDCQNIANDDFSSKLIDSSQPALANDADYAESAPEDIEQNTQDHDIPATDTRNEDVAIQSVIAAKPNKSRKSAAFFILGLFLLVLIGVAGSYAFIRNKEAHEAEEMLWSKCVEANTPLSYSQYLMQYPEGRFSSEAQDRIVTMRKQEDSDWGKLQLSDDVNKYTAFLIDHPNTPYKTAILSKIDSLSWINAQNDNTAAGYQAYIENANLGNYPGDYKEIAQEKFDYLSTLVTIEGDELKAVVKTIDDLFAAISNQKYKGLPSYMAPTLDNFFGVIGKSGENIALSIENDIKTKKLKSAQYIAFTDSIEIIRDNKGMYYTDIPLKRTVTYIDRKKKKEETLMLVHIELNERKRLSSLYEQPDKDAPANTD